MSRVLLVVFSMAFADVASAACMNKYVNRSEGKVRQIMTLLTGKLTFQEAETLAKAIESKQSPPVEWLDAKGKAIARQVGEMKVVRPMPVGCDGRSSGVIVVVTFSAITPPSSTISIRLDPNTVVEFEQQRE
jgi:hypothetical protein